MGFLYAILPFFSVAYMQELFITELTHLHPKVGVGTESI